MSKIDLSIKLSQFGLLISQTDCENLIRQVVEKAHKLWAYHSLRYGALQNNRQNIGYVFEIEPKVP